MRFDCAAGRVDGVSRRWNGKKADRTLNCGGDKKAGRFAGAMKASDGAISDSSSFEERTGDDRLKRSGGIER